MFGFYMQDKGGKDHKDNVHEENNNAMKHTAKTKEAVENVETTTDTAESPKGKEATNSEGYGFLGRFATDKDYQRQVIRRYVCFSETRDYLNQIKNCRQRIELLMKRQLYRSSVDMDATDIGIEITKEEQKLARLRADVSDEITKLNDVRLEMVLIKRYVDGMSWEKIAADMGSSVRTVQSIHGRALPAMEEVLIVDGEIELSKDGEDSYYNYYGHRGYRSNRYSNYQSYTGRSRNSRYYYSSNKYQQPYQHQEAHSAQGDMGYEETTATDDTSREPYGEYEDYEFFND